MISPTKISKNNGKKQIQKIIKMSTKKKEQALSNRENNDFQK